MEAATKKERLRSSSERKAEEGSASCPSSRSTFNTKRKKPGASQSSLCFQIPFQAVASHTAQNLNLLRQSGEGGGWLTPGRVPPCKPQRTFSQKQEGSSVQKPPLSEKMPPSCQSQPPTVQRQCSLPLSFRHDHRTWFSKATMVC